MERLRIDTTLGGSGFGGDCLMASDGETLVAARRAFCRDVAAPIASLRHPRDWMMLQSAISF
jgi:hypothetical protein